MAEKAVFHSKNTYLSLSRGINEKDGKHLPTVCFSPNPKGYGVLSTEDSDVISFIRKHPLFGKKIFLAGSENDPAKDKMPSLEEELKEAEETIIVLKKALAEAEKRIKELEKK